MKRLLAALIAAGLLLSACGGDDDGPIGDSAPTFEKTTGKATTDKAGTDKAGTNKAGTDKAPSKVGDSSTTTAKPSSKSSNKGSVSDAEAAALIAKSIRESDDSFPVTDAEAKCVGEKVVKALGTKRLQELDFMEADDIELADGEARKVAQGLLACVDLRDVFVAEMFSDTTVSASSQACVKDAMKNSDLEEALALSFRGADDEEAGMALISTMFTVLGKCLTPAELSGLGS